MSSKAVGWALGVRGISPSAKLTLVCLADYASHDTNECFPSVETLAEHILRDTRTVQRHLKELEAAGLLRREARRRADGSQSSTLYTLAVTTLVSPAPDKNVTPLLTPVSPLGVTPVSPLDPSIEPSIEEEVVDAGAPPPRPSCPYGEIRQLWIDGTGRSIAPVDRWAKGRKDAVRRLWSNGVLGADLEEWQAYFACIRRSKFLSGDNDRGWRADFDWALKPANVTKIEEDKFR